VFDETGIKTAVTSIIKAIGEDPEREGLAGTPGRVAEMYAELFMGLGKDPKAELDVGFELGHREMVILKDIPFYSMCEHHLLPFYGRVHVGYIPDGRIIGLSKIPRIVDVFARRLQVQERMTIQIAEAIQEALQPKGVGVVADGVHLCMMMRGVQKQNSSAMTSCLRGAFQTDAKTRNEFLAFVRSFNHR